MEPFTSQILNDVIYLVYVWYIPLIYMVYIRFQDFVGSIWASQSPRPRPTWYSGRRSSRPRRPGRLRIAGSASIDWCVPQVNDLSGRDIHFWFGDHLYWRSRVFLDFLCMDGYEVSSATMCPTTQCTSRSSTTCKCPKARLSDPDAVFPFRTT